MKRLVQVCPFLPPRPEGVAGYALALARGLRGRGIETEFLVPEPPINVTGKFSSHRLGADRLRGAVLVHYSNYGYDPNGCPGDLVGSIVTARAAGRISSLLVFFHEIYATAPPWRRTFWVSRFQKGLAGALAHGADHLATSIPLYADRLRALGARDPIEELPLPSTVGEPSGISPVGARPPRLVVFGGAGNRERLYRQHTASLAFVAAASGVRLILDIGLRPDVAPRWVGGVPVEACGPLTDEEVSAQLLTARLGTLAYPPDFFGKSTSFAALAAHGVPCVAVVPPKFRDPTAPHLTLRSALDVSSLDRVSTEVLAWYALHGSAEHVARAIDWLGNAAP